MKNSPAYQKAYRRNPSIHACACGEQAVTMRNSYPICQSCLDTSNAMKSQRDYAGTREYRSRAKRSKAEDLWSGELVGFKKEGNGWGSLELLEARLK